MAGTLREKVSLPELKDPVLISAFTTNAKGGASGTSTLAYLLTQWDAQPLAEFEADLYNLSRIRPQVRQDGDKRVIDWPTNLVYLANPPGADRSFLILIGIEPSFGWKGFVADIAEFAQRAGVRSAVSVRALPAGTSHRQPVSLQALYSSDSLSRTWRLAGGSGAQGPLDVGMLLSMQLQAIGCETVDIFALEPYYVPAMPYAATSIALIDAIDDAFGLDTPTLQLAEMDAAQQTAINSFLEQSKELQAVVGGIEASRNGAYLLGHAGEVQEALPLDPQEVIGDIEAMLGLNKPAGGTNPPPIE
jgi:hypothetical protein